MNQYVICMIRVYVKKYQTMIYDRIGFLLQRRNRGEIYGATSVMVGQNLPPLVGIGLRHLKI